MRLTIQNTYFNQRFGRNYFKSIDQSIKQLYNGILQYLLKYLAKTGEKITYSRGLPSYITADISDDDVVTEIWLWSQKLLLFDNATLYNEGEILGTLDDDALIQRLTQKAIKKIKGATLFDEQKRYEKGAASPSGLARTVPLRLPRKVRLFCLLCVSLSCTRQRATCSRQGHV